MATVGLFNAIAGKVRAQVAEWRLGASRSEADERALAAARELDADEVGRRADARAAERTRVVDRHGDAPEG